jgi:hypothetical protein
LGQSEGSLELAVVTSGLARAEPSNGKHSGKVVARLRLARKPARTLDCLVPRGCEDCQLANVSRRQRV